MSVLDEWINPFYLESGVVEDIREAIKAKPTAHYTTLDSFFKVDKLEQIIAQHTTLRFSEEADRRSKSGEWLPYDGAVVFAQPGVHIGSELFFDEEWHRYLAYLSCANLTFPTSTEIKLRWHKSLAEGFWIHTDSTIRSVVAICYFNQGWKETDGGLLQLWRLDETTCTPDVIEIEKPTGRLDFLTQHQRIRTASPGGGIPHNKNRKVDFVLIDQIVPTYNRLFLCNFQNNPAYHSVTPSNGRERTGFVQWIGTKHGSPKNA